MDCALVEALLSSLFLERVKFILGREALVTNRFTIQMLPFTGEGSDGYSFMKPAPNVGKLR
jgi:hypothetical protein